MKRPKTIPGTFLAWVLPFWLPLGCAGSAYLASKADPRRPAFVKARLGAEAERHYASLPNLNERFSYLQSVFGDDLEKSGCTAGTGDLRLKTPAPEDCLLLLFPGGGPRWTAERQSARGLLRIEEYSKDGLVYVFVRDGKVIGRRSLPYPREGMEERYRLEMATQPLPEFDGPAGGGDSAVP